MQPRLQDHSFRSGRLQSYFVLDRSAGQYFLVERSETRHPTALALLGLAYAQTFLSEALLIARGQHARSLELRAARDLAALWLDQGRRDEALQLLTPVYTAFTEGFETQDLTEERRCSTDCN